MSRKIRIVVAAFALSAAWSTYSNAGSYKVSPNYQHTVESSGFSYDEGSIEGNDCLKRYENGVVRSWYLKEKNARDYRMSYTFCRDVAPDGTLDDYYAKITHFSYSGNGYTGKASIPLDSLPTGVRIFVSTACSEFPCLPYPYKLSDVELFYNDAESILAGATFHHRTDPALSNGGAYEDLVCNSGYVLTKIRVRVRYSGSGGSNQAEIIGAKIDCSALSFGGTHTVSVP